jgi:hypothetical protein
MLRQLREKVSNVDVSAESVWKLIAVVCLSLMLGAAGEWFFRGRDTITRDDLVSAQSSIQTQMNNLQQTQGAQGQKLDDVNSKLGDLNVRMGKMEEDLKYVSRR